MEEWLIVVQELAALGGQRLTLLGGEPLLSKAWLPVTQRARALGLSVELISSGVGMTDAQVRAINDAQIASVTISVDGTQAIHDTLRQIPAAYAQALSAIRRLDQAGLRVGVATQVNALSLPSLELLAPLLEEAGAMGWQLQLTLPTGRARLEDGILARPEHMRELLGTVRKLIRRPGLRPVLTDTFGYCTHDEGRLRAPYGGRPRRWMGCFAGIFTLGITSRGDVKGCLALPEGFTEGNVRSRTLTAIWNDPAAFAYTRHFDPANLGGACASCPHQGQCRGGCNALSASFSGRLGQSVHCFFALGLDSPIDAGDVDRDRVEKGAHRKWCADGD